MADAVENTDLIVEKQEMKVTCDQSDNPIENKPLSQSKPDAVSQPATKVAPKNRRKSRKAQGRGQPKKG